MYVCVRTHTCTHDMWLEHIFIIEMVILYTLYTTLIAYTTSCIFVIKNWALYRVKGNWVTSVSIKTVSSYYRLRGKCCFFSPESMVSVVQT